MAKVRSNSGRLIIFLWVLLAAVFLGWVWWRDSVAAVDPEDFQPVMFTIAKGEGVRSIAGRLVSERLIRSAPGFYLLIKLQGFDQQIQAGQFRLDRTMDAGTVAETLTHGSFDIWITILEGWRVEEIATKLTKELDIPESEFLKYAREGYMFPDSYRIARDASAAAVAQLLQTTFAEKVKAKYAAAAAQTGLSFEQLIILASIVEREGRNNEDRPIIAGILLKRLRAGWPLQADATLQYALGYQSFEKSWWKKILTNEDKRINSPYNTYLLVGLPPAPIANPGLAAIRAVMGPTTTDYWFYLHDNQGLAHYAVTSEEHAQNIKLYLE